MPQPKKRLNKVRIRKTVTTKRWERIPKSQRLVKHEGENASASFIDSSATKMDLHDVDAIRRSARRIVQSAVLREMNYNRRGMFMAPTTISSHPVSRCDTVRASAITWTRLPSMRTLASLGWPSRIAEIRVSPTAISLRSIA